MSVTWRLVGLLALVFANGFFVASEFAIVAVRKTRIDQLVAEGHRTARAVRRAITAPDRYIAATQLGITTAHTISVAIAFTIITAVEIILGELVPKWIALEKAEMTSILTVRPME